MQRTTVGMGRWVRAPLERAHVHVRGRRDIVRILWSGIPGSLDLRSCLATRERRSGSFRRDRLFISEQKTPGQASLQQQTYP